MMETGASQGNQSLALAVKRGEYVLIESVVDEGADRTRSRRQRHRLLREAGVVITQGVRLSGSRVGQIEKLPIIVTGAKNGDVHLPTSPGRSARGLRMIPNRSEAHTSELQSLIRNTYAVCCLKKK